MVAKQIPYAVIEVSQTIIYLASTIYCRNSQYKVQTHSPDVFVHLTAPLPQSITVTHAHKAPLLSSIALFEKTRKQSITIINMTGNKSVSVSIFAQERTLGSAFIIKMINSCFYYVR